MRRNATRAASFAAVWSDAYIVSSTIVPRCDSENENRSSENTDAQSAANIEVTITAMLKFRVWDVMLPSSILDATTRRSILGVLPVAVAILVALFAFPFPASAQDDGGNAKTAAEMKEYTQKLRNTEISFKMVPIPGGEFVMGSPESEEDRNDDEGPQHKVKLEPFWMGKTEVTW